MPDRAGVGDRAAVTVRAPGKLMLSGEYAVLAGAPAVLACVDRFVTVTATPRSDGAGDVRITGPQTASGHYALVSGTPRWQVGSPAMPLVDAVFAVVRPAIAMDLTIDSSPFYEDGRKLGLGSSAAVAVALTAALAGAAHCRDIVTQAVEAHRRFQHGVGSGADVRAIAYGGTVAQSGGGRAVEVSSLAWPAALRVVPVIAAHAADTIDHVSRFLRWHRDHPAASGTVGEAAARAQRVVREWRRTDARAIIEAMEAFTQQIDRIDQAAGLGYWAGGHRQLAELAADCGCAYKPSGAGGGDFGLLLSDADAPVDAFRRALTAAGIDGLRTTTLGLGHATPSIAGAAA